MKSDASSLEEEVRQESSQRMDGDSSMGTYSLGIKNVREGWKMSDKRKIFKRGKGDCSLRMESGARR